MDGHLGYQRQRIGQGVNVGGRRAAEAAQQAGAFYFVNHFQGVGPRDGAEAQGHVVIHFHHYAAGAEQQDGAELGVVGNADDGFHAAGYHLLHCHAVNAGVRGIAAGGGGDVGKGGAYLGGVGQVQPDSAGFGFMQDVRRIDFQRHRIADAVGGGDGGIGIGSQRVLRGGQAKGGQQRLAVVFGEGAGTGQSGGGIPLGGGHCGRIGEAARQPAFPPVVVIVEMADAGGQFVGHIENGDAGLPERGQTGLGAAGARPEEGHGFVAGVALGDDLRGLGVGAGGGYHQGAHAFVAGHTGHNGGEVVAVGEAGDIGGVGGPAEAFEDVVDAVAGVVGKGRQVQAGLPEHIGGEAADAAGMGDHGHAPARGPGAAGQQVGDLEQVVIILHPDDAVLGEGGVIYGVNAGEGGGVGAGGAGAQFGAADFDEHDGLAAFRRQPGHFQKLAPVLETFNEAGDDAGGSVVQQVAGEVAEVQVGFVAGGDDVGKADALVHGAGEEGAESGGAALADQADGAGQAGGAPGGGAGPDVVLEVGEAEAVGAADAQTRFPGEPAQVGLQFAAVVQAALGEAGGDDDGGFGAFGVAFPQGVQHGVVGDDDAHHIGGFGQSADRGVAGDALDFLVAGVDGIDIDAAGGLQGSGEEAAAVLHPGGGADDGDGTGVEHPVDGCQLLVGPEGHRQSPG